MSRSADAQEVERAFAHARSSSTGWWRVDCPLCAGRTGKPDRKQALAINARSGVYTCWKCQATGKTGVAMDLPPVEAHVDVAEVDPPEWYVPLHGDESLSLEAARAYAAKRCRPEYWRDVQIGACAMGQFAGRVIVPVLGDDDAWLGWVGRTWYPCAKAYTYPKGMQRGEVTYRGGILREVTDEPALVVEGVFDALHLWPRAVAVLGKASEKQMEALADASRPIVIVLDGDAWMEALAMSLRLRLHGQRAGYVRLPPKLDPDEVPLAWLDEEVRRAL